MFPQKNLARKGLTQIYDVIEPQEVKHENLILSEWQLTLCWKMVLFHGNFQKLHTK